jgi:hypothetical protein
VKFIIDLGRNLKGRAHREHPLTDEKTVLKLMFGKMWTALIWGTLAKNGNENSVPIKGKEFHDKLSES